MPSFVGVGARCKTISRSHCQPSAGTPVNDQAELCKRSGDAAVMRRHRAEPVPSVSTIWRILVRRGFVTPQPQKRPHSSFIRFEAEMPNAN
jgi:hypothetical protein